MQTVAIIQARIVSSRLPGKILKPLAGRPALWHVVKRLEYCRRLERIIVATTTKKEDDRVEEFCSDHKFACYRGSAEDVLDRYYQAAKAFGVDLIVRITGDCPLVDPTIVDDIVEGYFKEGYDFCGLSGEFPDGLDCSVFSFSLLEDTWKHAHLPSEREHVCPYMEKHPEKYKIGRLDKFKGLGHHRWTLDEDVDFLFLQEVFDRLYIPGTIFLTQDILNLLEREPYLMEINSGIIRNEGYIKSLREDEEYLRGKDKASSIKQQQIKGKVR